MSEQGAPTELPDRATDGSVSREDYQPRRVQPNSLLWKYYGDHRISLLGGRAGPTENMYPQLGQAVSDHSVIFTDLFERVRRSTGPINETIYGTDPSKVALRIRNFHKPLKGTVQDSSIYNGTGYHGLDPQTYYWAHATFLDMTYAYVERFIKPLTDAEKEQLFQESRDWFSLYGVDDSAQPATYQEFKDYWDRVVREELVGDSRVAQFTVGYISKGITRAFPTPNLPPWLWQRVLAPAIDRFVAFIGAGGLDDDLRAKLDIPWTAAQARRYDRFCAFVRRVGPAWERLAPLEWRYNRQAVEGFRREGIDPRTIKPAG